MMAHVGTNMAQAVPPLRRRRGQVCSRWCRLSAGRGAAPHVVESYRRGTGRADEPVEPLGTAARWHRSRRALRRRAERVPGQAARLHVGQSGRADAPAQAVPTSSSAAREAASIGFGRFRMPRRAGVISMHPEADDRTRPWAAGQPPGCGPASPISARARPPPGRHTSQTPWGPRTVRAPCEDPTRSAWSCRLSARRAAARAAGWRGSSRRRGRRGCAPGSAPGRRSRRRRTRGPSPTPGCAAAPEDR
jgi:hypothetical protein